MKAPSEARFKAILDGSGAGTWEWNLGSGELIVNPRWSEMLGFELSELEPVTVKTWEGLSHPVDKEAALLMIEQVRHHQAKRYDCVVRMKHKNGSWRFIHTTGMLVEENESSGGQWIVGTHIDITEHKQTQHQLTQLAESLPGVIYSFVMEPGGRYHFPYLSKKIEDFYGFSPEIGMRNPDRLFEALHPEDLGRVKETVADSFESLCEWLCDYRVQIQGEARWMRGIAKPERDGDGAVTWHGMIINIDEQKRLEAELERLSVTDELTGAFNRRHILKELDVYLAEHTRYGRPFSLVSIDIDHFKVVNDTYGHLVGDEVLREFSNVISTRIRKTDIFARAGGEEFLILMPQTSMPDAASLVDSIRETLEKYNFEAPEGQTFQITISAGVVGCSQRKNVDVAEILSVCDQSLYQAKRDGRNRLVLNTI